MKTVLLTGATGYIGKFAIPFLLAENYTVHAVTFTEISFGTAENLFWHQADLLDSLAIDRLIERISPTHLLHFAWYVEHGKFWNAVENLDWLCASLYLTRKFAENGGERMVSAGTCAEYDWSAPNPLTEYATPSNAQSLYGASKNALNSTLEKFAEAYNFSFASGRIFFPFGANEPANRLIPSVIRSLLANEPAQTSHGNQVRDFVYVEEIAEAFVTLLASDVRGVVNIGSGKGIALREIIEEIADIIGKPELLRIGALPSPPGEPAEIIADVRRLRMEVGFGKVRDLRKSLEDTISWWKKEL